MSARVPTDSSFSQGSPAVVSDVNHAAELIRKKCELFLFNAPL